MARPSVVLAALFGGALIVTLTSTQGCAGGSDSSGFGGSSGGGSGGSSGGSSGGGSGSGSGGTGSGSGSFGDGGGSGGSSSGGGGCPSGLQCSVSCSGGTTTTISGKVYNPALKNPLYNVAVYVPATALQPLPRGVPTGADACSCPALFKSGAVATTTTGVDGSFKLTNAPVSTSGGTVPLVLQIGKWRRVVDVHVTQCEDNPQPDKSLSLPGTVAAGDTNDNMPDIAVSTGGADTLECLMNRIGLPATEYGAGAGGSGHIHVFAGGANSSAWASHPESPGMPGAPASSTSLWDSQADLMPYDIVLLSCEGGETYNANPPALEAYLNAGGRAFSSHYHYSWFSGPIDSVGVATYTAPPDWGTNLATWSDDGPKGPGPIGGVIDQTLNGSTAPFPKGQALYEWLGLVQALGQNGVSADALSLFTPRYNAKVGPSNTPSQPWINSSPWTMYFSFDTPVDAPKPTDGGAPNYCGRAVFSDLHVSGKDVVGANIPTNCVDTDLSPQEKALEFMLFDLSSCVLPDSVQPPDSGVPITQ